jgi:hypothetical protein
MKVKMYLSLLQNIFILLAVACEFWCAILFDLGNRCTKLLHSYLLPSLKKSSFQFNSSLFCPLYMHIFASFFNF